MSTYCEWHKVHHEAEKCPKCTLEEWKGMKNAGCMMVVLLWPFALLGTFLGAMYSAFISAFKKTKGLWDESWRDIRKPKPPKGRVTKEE